MVMVRAMIVCVMMPMMMVVMIFLAIILSFLVVIIRNVIILFLVIIVIVVVIITCTVISSIALWVHVRLPEISGIDHKNWWCGATELLLPPGPKHNKNK